jgi:hypothetical protein
MCEARLAGLDFVARPQLAFKIRVIVVPQWAQVPIRAQWPDRNAEVVARRSTAQWHW